MLLTAAENDFFASFSESHFASHLIFECSSSNHRLYADTIQKRWRGANNRSLEISLGWRKGKESESFEDAITEVWEGAAISSSPELYGASSAKIWLNLLGCTLPGTWSHPAFFHQYILPVAFVYLDSMIWSGTGSVMTIAS
jgi:hypothetical protein